MLCCCPCHFVVDIVHLVVVILSILVVMMMWLKLLVLLLLWYVVDDLVMWKFYWDCWLRKGVSKERYNLFFCPCSLVF